MAIKSKDDMPTSRKLEIDLTGPQGNAYCLIGITKDLAKQLGKESTPIIEEMIKGDYEDLLKVFEREFGQYVDLYR